MFSKLKHRVHRMLARASTAHMARETERDPEAFSIHRRPSMPSDSRPEELTPLSYEIAHKMGEITLNPDRGNEVERPEDLALEERTAEVTDPVIRKAVLELVREEVCQWLEEEGRAAGRGEVSTGKEDQDGRQKRTLKVKRL